VIAGVCGGLGNYFEIDPVFVRIVAVLLALMPVHGFGVLAYIVAWIIIPKKEPEMETTDVKAEKPVHHSSWNKYLPGIILIGIGIVLLVRENWYWFRWEEFWPILLIVVGLVLIFRRPAKHNATTQTEEPMKVNGQEAKPENGGSIS
jgi:phage shock protein PspC (stress-responsive transcriptional regulator)